MYARPKVTFDNVSKRYTLHQKKLDKILELFSIKGQSKSFYALKNISFTVNEGETIGVIGINGSGKSTLSNILAEVIPPTSGKFHVNGETSLIAIAVGLNNNLTGLENIELKCLMQGLKPNEIKKITPLIIDFADIGDFINQPVKTYSSGMKSRLGFAISAHTNPDIMVIDEALSVGDQTFYEKCLEKMNEFKKEGKTIFYISHSASQIRSFCDKTMWIHYGELIEFGNTKDVLSKYSEFIKYFNGLSDEEKAAYKKEKMKERQKDSSLNSSSSSRLNRSVKKTKSNSNVIIEISILLFLFFISCFLMIFGIGQSKESEVIKNLNVSAAGSKLISNNGSSKGLVKKTADQITDIKKVGYIRNETVPVYQTNKLKSKLLDLNFSNQVYVEKKINNVFEITVGNKKGFINEDDAYIPSSDFVPQDFNLVKYLPALPKSFVSSFEYYLVFLNSNQNEIESRIRGLTGKVTDENGNNYIVFGKVKYRINQSMLADEIIISEFDPQKIDFQQLIEKASLVSKDKNAVYILGNGNGYIFNRNNNTLTVTPEK